MLHSWDGNSGGCLRATSEMSELQTALSEGELTLANSTAKLVGIVFHLVERSVRSRKSFFLLLKCFVDGVAVLLVMTLKCKNSAFCGRHLPSPIAVQ